jgi:hypothetical protein
MWLYPIGSNKKLNDRASQEILDRAENNEYEYGLEYK